jgi:hypothetical protein
MLNTHTNNEDLTCQILSAINQECDTGPNIENDLSGWFDHLKNGTEGSMLVSPHSVENLTKERFLNKIKIILN